MIHVPTHFFKVVVARRRREVVDIVDSGTGGQVAVQGGDNGTTKQPTQQVVVAVAAFLVPNNGTNGTPSSLEPLVVQLSELEVLTGISFAPCLQSAGPTFGTFSSRAQLHAAVDAHVHPSR